MHILEIFKWPLTILAGFTIFILLFSKDVSSFLKEISWLKTKWFELKRIREEIFAKAEEVKELSRQLAEDKQELKTAVITFTETLYLTLQSRHKFPIPEKISNEITKNLNSLAELAIKRKTDEAAFRKRMVEIDGLLEKEVKR